MFFLRNNSTQLPECPKRILLIQFGSVGEVIHGLPLLVALRMRFPYTEIAWLVEESTVPILKGHPALNRILIAKKRWNHSSSRVRFLRNRLRLFNPDITIDLQGSVRSTSAAWISGAKHRIGFSICRDSQSDLRKGNRFLNNIRITANETHSVDRNLQIMELFGVQGCSVAFDLHESEISRIRTREILSGVGLHGNFVLFNLGANEASLRWPHERFAKLARYLEEQWNLPSLITWYGEEEYAFGESIVQSAGGAAILSPYTALNELASLTRCATILVSADAAALHIAAAVATPCLGLFGKTSAVKIGPYGLRNHVIQAHAPFAVQSGQTFEAASSENHEDFSRNMMKIIETSSVCRVCDEMLNEIHHRTSTEKAEKIMHISAETLQHRMVLHHLEPRTEQYTGPSIYPITKKTKAA